MSVLYYSYSVEITNSVLPLNEANDICRNFDGNEFHFTLCDERDAMLICAYIELIVPFASILGSFFFRDDGAHIWGSNLPAFGSAAAGAIYLSLYYMGSFVKS